MKSKLLLVVSFVVLLCMCFTFSVLAEDNVPQVTDTYYLVNSEESPAYADLTAQGAKVVCYDDIIGDTTGTQSSVFFGGFSDGSHVEIVFAEDIIVPKEMARHNYGILISNAITVTFKYNGFGHYILSGTYVNDSEQEVASSNNGIVVRNRNATVRLIGTKGMDNAGTVSDVFSLPTVDIALGTCDTSSSNLDVYKTTLHYLSIIEGNAYVENLRGYTTNSVIYAEQNVSTAQGTYEVYNSAMSAVNDRAFSLNSTQSKIIKIDNSYIKGLAGYSVLDGSYVYNSTITGAGIYIDSWHNPGKVWHFVNCNIPGDRIGTGTGRTYLCFTDCTFRDGMKWQLSGDNGGNQYIRIFTSPTCEQPGTMEMKQSTNRGGENPFAEEYANFSSPALGHTGGADWAFNYAGDKYLSELTATKGCTRCGLWEPQTVYVGTMFQALGYSVPQFGNNFSITAGFSMNKDAIQKYEELSGSKLSFGCVVALKDCLGENIAPLDGNGNAVTLEIGNVIKADMTSNINCYMNVKVKLTSEHADTMLLITGYIAETKDEAILINYMQSDNKLVESNNFQYVSYNNY